MSEKIGKEPISVFTDRLNIQSKVYCKVYFIYFSKVYIYLKSKQKLLPSDL